MQEFDHTNVATVPLAERIALPRNVDRRRRGMDCCGWRTGALGATGTSEASGAEKNALTFVQISDTHIDSRRR